MLRIKALLLGVTVAVAALAALAGTASAFTEFTASRAGAITSTSSGKLTFTAGSNRIECRVTMRGSLRTGPIAIANGKMGEITGVAINECAGSGEIERALTETPWEVVSNSLEERIPQARLTIKQTKFRFSIFGGFARCLYVGDALAIQALSGANPYTTGRQTAETSSVFTLNGGEFGCPREGRMEGRFDLAPVQTLTAR
jgi:hypothetical protein